MICDAIGRKRVLEFYYDGYPRSVEPHACGNDTKGNDVVRAYQISGGSESGEYVGWKLFKLSKMNYMEISTTTFAGPRPDYKRGDSAMRVIYCQL